MAPQNALAIDNIVARPGTKVTGLLEVGRRPDATVMGLPVHVVRGANPGRTLVVDACTHGDEVEGTLAVLQFVEGLDPAALSGTVICVPVLNMYAFEMGQRGAYPGGEVAIYDMNRIMPGAADGPATLRLVHLYFSKIVAHADFVVSLHGGGLQQYRTERIIYQERSEASLDLAKSLGPAWSIVQEDVPQLGSIERACTELGKPCVITELGGSPARFPDEYRRHVSTMVESLHNLLRHYAMSAGAPQYAKEWIRVAAPHGLHCTNGGVMVPAPDLVMKRRCPPNTPLARLIDLFGREAEVVRAPYDGVVLGYKSMMYCRAADIAVSFGRVLDVAPPSTRVS